MVNQVFYKQILENYEKKYTILIAGNKIATEECPKYLGIKFDKILTYNQHLESVKNKLKARNNIIAKLVSTSWGCSTYIFRTSVLA